jgi:hypothetical protein
MVAERQLALTDIARKADPIVIDFALEAKCKHIESGVGVKELPWLISRLRRRQFSILVTTSFLAEQELAG